MYKLEYVKIIISSHHLLCIDTKQHSKKSPLSLLISVVRTMDLHSEDSLNNGN